MCFSHSWSPEVWVQSWRAFPPRRRRRESELLESLECFFLPSFESELESFESELESLECFGFLPSLESELLESFECFGFLPSLESELESFESELESFESEL